MIQYLARFVLKDWLGTFLLPSIPLIILGWLVVPVAMLWRYDGTPKTEHPSEQEHWKYIRLPKWAWIWETNSGLMGDGSYIKTYIWHPSTWAGQYYWTAWRNPIRGWKYKVAGIDLDGTQKIEYWGAKEVDDVSGKFGCHFVVTKVGNRTVTGLYGVWRLTDKYCFRLRIGFKVKPGYLGKVRRVGGTPLSLSIKEYQT